MQKQFVFVPLQYQPGANFIAWRRSIWDQFLNDQPVWKHFASAGGYFWKEHSAQFHPRMDGHLGRFEFNYRDIAAPAKCNLVSEKLPFFRFDWQVHLFGNSPPVRLVWKRWSVWKPVLVFGPLLVSVITRCFIHLIVVSRLRGRKLKEVINLMMMT